MLPIEIKQLSQEKKIELLKKYLTDIETIYPKEVIPSNISPENNIKNDNFDMNEFITNIKAKEEETEANIPLETKFLAFNVFLLIKGKNLLDDKFFKNKDVIFNDALEFLDIGDELNIELNIFKAKLIGTYLSSLKHCNIMTTMGLPKIPLNIKLVLLMLDYNTLSNIFEDLEEDKINLIDDNIYYEDAFKIIISLSSKVSYFNNMLFNNFKINEYDSTIERKEAL